MARWNGSWGRGVLGHVGGALVLAVCMLTPPEHGVHEAIAELQSAIVQWNASALDDAIAENCNETEGLDRAVARRRAQA